MITEITDHGIDLTGNNDTNVDVDINLPVGDWTISIDVKDVKGNANGDWGNLFQQTVDGPYILDSIGNGTNRLWGTGQPSASGRTGIMTVDGVELGELPDDEWVTITITRQGNSLSFYANAVFQFSEDADDPSALDNIKQINGGGYPVAGDVANFRVFEGAATAEEVAQLLDTSSEDDSDSNNGENLTQPTEEYNMSGFDFTKDLSESYQDATENNGTVLADGTIVSGAAAPSFKDCKMKKFLSAVEAKGMKLCGDLVMTKGDIFLKDGTNLEAVVKNIEIVYGEKWIDNSGSEPVDRFTNMDPAGLGLSEAIALPDDSSTASPADNPASVNPQMVMEDTTSPASNRASAANGGKVGYYLRVTRPSGAHEYLELAPLNTLLDGLGSGGEIVSLLGVLNEIEDAQDLMKAALDGERVARLADVEALEAQFGRDVNTFIQFLGDLETQITGLVPAAVSHVEQRILNVSSALEEQHSADRMHAALNVSDLTDQGGEDICDGLAFEFLSGAIQDSLGSEKTSRQDISKWMIDVQLESKDSADSESARLRRQDFDVTFEASMESGKIKITGLLEACDDLLSGDDTNDYFLVANAIWCGAGDNIQEQAKLGEYTASMPPKVSEGLTFANEDADADGTPRKVTYAAQS